MRENIDLIILPMFLLLIIFYLFLYLPIERENCNKVKKLLNQDTTYMVGQGCYVNDNGNIVKVELNKW